jgi:hypothetical protein
MASTPTGTITERIGHIRGLDENIPSKQDITQSLTRSRVDQRIYEIDKIIKKCNASITEITALKDIIGADSTSLQQRVYVMQFNFISNSTNL